MYFNTYPDSSNVWQLFDVPVGEHDLLASRLIAYNANLRARSYRVFDHIWISNQRTVETVVDNAGTPGQILSGGAMTISGGAILNDNSKILAGGTLDISGSDLDNTETDGHREVSDHGSYRRDFIEYSPYRLRAGEFGSGAYVLVTESVTTKLDTSRAEGAAGVQGTGTQLANHTAPTNSIIRANPDSTASYIFETDPRFTNQRQWLSSDYMLQSLATDPTTLQKRIGDGFYEQKLIREQVAELTGRRFLDGYASDEAQYQALMEAGATYAREWNLVPGISLNASQVAQLTSDIVWLVEKQVKLPDGSITTALVPQVYMMPRDGDLAANGSLLAGQSVNIQLTGDLKNSGTIAGRNLTSLNAENVHNLGQVSGKEVNVKANKDIIVEGGLMIAEDVLTATAGRDLTVKSTTSTSTVNVGSSSSSLTQVDRVAGLYVTKADGVLVATAGNDLSVLAGVLSSQGDVKLGAGNNATLGTVDTSSSIDFTSSERNFIRKSSTTEVGSQIQSGGNTTIAAGADLNVRATSVQATGDLAASAGRDINIVEGRATTQSDDSRYAKHSGFMSKSVAEIRSQSQSDTSIGSSLSGNNVQLQAFGDVNLRAVELESTQGLTVTAGNNVNIEAAHNRQSGSSFQGGQTGGLTGGRTTKAANEYGSTTAVVSQLQSNDGFVTVTAGKDVVLEGTQIQAKSDVLLYGGNQVLAVATHDTTYSSSESSSYKTGLFVEPGLVPIRPETRGSGNATTTRESIARGANISSSTGDITLYGAGAVGLEGATLTAREGDIGIAGAVVDIRAAIEGTSNSYAYNEKGAKINQLGLSNLSEGVGRKTSDITNYQATNLERTTLEAQNVTITATIGDLQLAGSTINASDTLTLAAANGAVSLGGQQTEIMTSTVSTGRDLMYQKMRGEGTVEQTTNYNLIEANTVVIDAPRVTAQVGSKDSVEQLAKRPGMEWVGQLKEDPILKDKVDWKVIEDVSKKWDYKAQGLTQEGAAVVTILVAYFTAGAFSGAGEAAATGAGMATTSATGVVTLTSGGTILAGATTAALTTLATQAAIAVANNPGDPGAALQELGSSANVKNLVAAMITGGVLNGIGFNPTGQPAVKGGGQSFGTQLGQNLQAGVAKALVNSAVYGTSLEDNLKSSLLTAFLDTAAAQTAFAIGENIPAGTAANLLAHALAGCAAGVVRVDGGCGAGALGASIGELAASIIDPYGINEPSDTVRFASMIGGIAAAISGLDAVGINLASQAASNTAANNYVSRSPFVEVRRAVNQENARLTKECGTSCTEQDFQRIDQQMAMLERGMNLSVAASRSTLTLEQAQQLGQILLELAPIYGTSESLVQLVTGTSSMTGEEVNRFWAAVGVVPIAGGILRKVGEPSVESLSVLLRNADNLGVAGANKTGTVWDAIRPVGPMHPGSVIPQSFELSLENGAKIWVDGNATKHVAEYAATKAINSTPEAVRLVSQVQLASLESAVNTAVQNGITYRQVIKVNNWELIFAPPKSADQFPALYHALYKGK